MAIMTNEQKLDNILQCYPSFVEVQLADHMALCRWFRLLPRPSTKKDCDVLWEVIDRLDNWKYGKAGEIDNEK